MPSPFDDPSESFGVLVNHEGQHSLWPSDAPIPAGWSAVFGPAGRDDCLAYVEAHWTDISPLSLARAGQAKHSS